MPCVCLLCRTHFDTPPVRDNEYWASRCETCGKYICPFCRSHNINIADGSVVLVSPKHSVHVRATVWGRGN
jgi:methionyl-tRNA synthetase